jgi:gamma-glutamylcyclotransferase (GGCT)/AIG2-like uncharacterized protein YtfP
VIDLYFAYGSNMKTARLRERLPSVRALGIARLEERRLLVKKRGADGTAKANLVPSRGGVVWGVLFEIATRDWSRLDRHEQGYVRTRVLVQSPSDYTCEAITYVSNRPIDAVPFDWYRALLIEGAREHGLPDDYVARLEALPYRPSHPSKRR